MQQSVAPHGTTNDGVRCSTEGGTPRLIVIWLGAIMAMTLLPKSIDQAWLADELGFKMGLSLVLVTTGVVPLCLLVIGRGEWQITPLDLPMFLLIELVALQILWATLNPLGDHHWMASWRPVVALWVFLGPVVPYWLLTQCASLNDTTVYVLLLGLVAVGVVQAVIGFATAIFPHFFVSRFRLEWDSTVFLRMYTPMGTQAFASLLMMILPLIITLLVTSRHTWPRHIFVLMLTLAGSALLLTGSRVSILLGAVGSLVTYILTQRILGAARMSTVVWRSVLICLVLGSTVWFVSTRVAQRSHLSATRVARFGHASDQRRLEKLAYALESFARHPVLGKGWGAGPARGAVSPVPDAVWSHTIGDLHGLYHTALAELGLPGLLLFWLVAYRVMRPGLRFITNKSGISTRTRLHAVALQVSATTLIIHSLSESYLLFHQRIAAVFWIIAGLIFVCDRLDRNYRARLPS